MEIKRVEMASLGKGLADVSLDTLVGTQHSAVGGRQTADSVQKNQGVFFGRFYIKKEFLFLVLHHLPYCSILVLRNMAQVGSWHTLYFSADF